MGEESEDMAFGGWDGILDEAVRAGKAVSARTEALHRVRPATTIYDSLVDPIKATVDKPSLFRKLTEDIRNINDYNGFALLTNIVGKQAYINDAAQSTILSDLGLTLDQVKDAYDSSEYYQVKSAKKMERQLLFGLPLVILCGCLAKERRDADAISVYQFAMLKPYASLCSQSFQKGVNEDMMLATIEDPAMSMRFDIKKLGSVQKVFENKASIRYENYKETLRGPMTDKQLDDIFCSGIYTSTAVFVWAVAKKYYANVSNAKKNRFLSYERDYKDETDSDGKTSTVERDINSDSAVIASYVHSSLMQYSTSPINERFITLSARYGFSSGTDRHNENIVRTAISDVDDKRSDLIRPMFECLLGAFLHSISPATHEKYVPDDISTPMFLMQCNSIITGKQGSKDTNVLEVKRMLDDMVAAGSMRYASTVSGQIKKALLMYYTLFVMNSKKESY
jgi:hypothetical protein